MYYKIINDGNIIGVVTEDDFRRYQTKHGVIIYSDEDHAQYVQNKNILYHDNWLKAPVPNIESIDAKIQRIDEDEYNLLLETLEIEEQIPIDETDEIIEEDEPNYEGEDITLDFVKSSKIKQMSSVCHNAITNGFDIELSDGKVHHFSMSIEDQIKIQTLATKARSGETMLPWHSDGELCVFYPAEDILRIYAQLEILQTYHTTYFNSLKYYIESMDTMEAVSQVWYGMNIPEEYQSEVLKYLLEQNNENNS